MQWLRTSKLIIKLKLRAEKLPPGMSLHQYPCNHLPIGYPFTRAHSVYYSEDQFLRGRAAVQESKPRPHLYKIQSPMPGHNIPSNGFVLFECYIKTVRERRRAGDLRSAWPADRFVHVSTLYSTSSFSYAIEGKTNQAFTYWCQQHSLTSLVRAMFAVGMVNVTRIEE